MDLISGVLPDFLESRMAMLYSKDSSDHDMTAVTSESICRCPSGSCEAGWWSLKVRLAGTGGAVASHA